MRNPIQMVIESRISVEQFKPDCPLPDSILQALVAQACCAPSAYNFQNWRFIAVRSEAAKRRLHAQAYKQTKVLDASACFIVCGTLRPHLQLARHLAPSVQAGLLHAQKAQAWVDLASHSHGHDLGMQRDEAIRSAALAGMTLMLAAEGMGLSSCAMTGFDAAGVAAAFALGEDDVPALLVAVGQSAEQRGRQKVRRDVADVLEMA